MAEPAISYCHKIVSQVEECLTPKESASFNEVVRRYRNHRIGTEGLAAKSVDQALDCVKRLMLYTHKPIWATTELDIDNYFGHLAHDLKRERATRRNYQIHIKSMFDFLLTDREMCEIILKEFGVRVRQLIIDKARILHKTEYEGKHARRPMSRHHVKLFFDALDREIEKAYFSGSKTYWTLCRDKAMLYLIYTTGIRRAEAAGLSLGSFTENPSEPRFGRFGSWFVFGKGGKSRGVLSLLVRIKTIMDWYLDEIRPKLLNGREDPKALFLGEGGEPISDDVVYQAYTRALDFADLDGLGYTVHCLRNTYATNATPFIGIEATSDQLGHTLLSTTCGYHSPPVSAMGRQISNAINRQFDKQKN